VKKYPELHRREFEQFLEQFCMTDSLKFRNNKWIGLTRGGKPFTVHVKHGTTINYPPRLVEVVARDLRVTPEEFSEWYQKK
jgi:hypothetical protein